MISRGNTILGGLARVLGVMAASQSIDPRVTTRNGTYQGRHLVSYDQDIFLGIPYAQPPTGNLRFQNPQSLNQRFSLRNATDYADSCVGYGNSDAWPHTLGEDCLTLNIVKPASASHNSKKLLPVGVWIHGGAWVSDYAANGNYNATFIVHESVKMGKPIMAVSIDFRQAAWGFMASDDMISAGVTNLGLKDQRLALRWIRENIRAFGGDPDKVTIWGESSGGGNVACQATAYGGRDERLFRGLIAQSGGDWFHMKNLSLFQKNYDAIIAAVGCKEKVDKLQCLRHVPFEQLNDAIVEIPMEYWPFVDGDFIPDYPSNLVKQGKFTRVPSLIGTNADEGSKWLGSGPNSDKEFRDVIKSYSADDRTTEFLMALYPDIDSIGLPAGYNVPSGGSMGLQYKRLVALASDYFFVSWHRLRTSMWSRYDVPVYSYLFDSPGKDPAIGTTHGDEIGYVFNNVLGLGYSEDDRPLRPESPRKVLDLARLMTRMWVSFIHDLDPNNHGIRGTSKWPLYNATGGRGQNYLLQPHNSHAVADIPRIAGTAFLNSIAAEYLGQ